MADQPNYPQTYLRLLFGPGGIAAATSHINENIEVNFANAVGSLLEVMQIQASGMSSTTPITVDGAAKFFNIQPHFAFLTAGRYIHLRLESDPSIFISGITTSLQTEAGDINMDVSGFGGAGVHGGAPDKWIVGLGHAAEMILPAGLVPPENGGWGTDMRADDHASGLGDRTVGIQSLELQQLTEIESIKQTPPVPAVDRRQYLVGLGSNGEALTGDFVGHEGEIATELTTGAGSPGYHFRVPLRGQQVINALTDERLEKFTSLARSPAWPGATWGSADTYRPEILTITIPEITPPNEYFIPPSIASGSVYADTNALHLIRTESIKWQQGDTVTIFNIGTGDLEWLETTGFVYDTDGIEVVGNVSIGPMGSISANYTGSNKWVTTSITNRN